MEFFAHPWYMAAGGALISSPILIHLINRMRFKRIRWAAMEFLLKSQKRNRRRLIIEQMILLLLRILLVLLAAFLVARFLYGGVGPRGASHVVIVDDTLSMLDSGKEAGRDTTAYETAIEQIKEVVRNAAQASSKQDMRIFLLSELDKSPLFDARLSDQSVYEVDKKFADRLRKPTLLHVSPLEGLRKGRQFLASQKGEIGQKILHFVSDFRASDWTGPDREKIKQEVDAARDEGTNVNFIDVAAPFRGSTGKVALNHDNVAIVDLKAETRVAIEDAEVEFTATVMNHGQGEASPFLEVYVNGEHDLSRDTIIEKLAPGNKVDHKFTLRFPARKGKPGSEITEKDTVEERERKRRLERDHFHVRVTIRREPVGLNVDNVRDMVIEVRKKVPTLVVDGNKPEGRGEAGDMSHLQSFYAASGVYETEERRLADLEKADLDLYPCIILLNVGEIPQPVVNKLKTYVENGGSLCYFMGEECKADHYNTTLFKAGLFPLQVTETPYDPLAAAFTDPDLRKKERDRLRQSTPQPKILFRDPEKNLLGQRLAAFTSLFRYLSVNVYWQAQPRSRWDPDGRHCDTPIVLPNASSIDKYRGRATELINNAIAAAEKLAAREPEMKRFLAPLADHAREIRNALVSGELYRLAEKLNDLLTNPGVKDDPSKPRMSDLWGHNDMKALAEEIKEFRDSVLYGDPLVVSKTQGKGRVVAVLTTAGTALRRGVGEEAVQWNNWGAGDRVVSDLYPLFLIDLHRYLVSEGQAPNRVLGEQVQFTLDATRYDPKFSWVFQAQPDLSVERPMKEQDQKEKGVMEKAGNSLTFALKDVRRPGVYRINLTMLGDGPEEDRQEVRAYAYNIDSQAESDLRRAPREVLLPEETAPGDSKRGKLTLRAPGDTLEEFQEKQPDASESPWLYLFFIVILVVEQAMAVHLSYHLKSDTTTAAPLGHARPATAA
jgi:hypothetical protein